MVEIEIRGFQSIEHVTLKVEGFTALVGRSGIGKTAIVRAVKAALTNALGTSFVRHGAACLRRSKGTKTCKCEVMVHLRAPSFDLKWRKGDAVNEYVFNGETKTVPGRGFPDFLSPGFAPIQLGDSQKLLQVSDQFSPLFLLDQSGATVANILSDVARLDAVNVAMKHVEKDRREANSLRKVREKDVEGLVKSLVSFDGLDGALGHVEFVAEAYDRLHTAERRAQGASALCTRLADLVSHIRFIQGVDKIHAPEPDGVRQQAVACFRVAAWSNRVTETAAAYRAIEGSSKIVPPDVTSIRTTAESAVRAQVLARTLHANTTLVSSLDGVLEVVVPDTRALSERVQHTMSAAALHAKYDVVLASVHALDGVDAITPLDTTPLEKQGRSMVLLGDWVHRMLAFRTWFDTRKSVEDAIVPDPGPWARVKATLGKMADMLYRHAAIKLNVDTLEDEYLQIIAEQTEADGSLAAFMDIARANGWVCGECAQPLRSDHAHARRVPDGPASIPV